MDDLITEFLAETNEGLSQLDNDLVQLESDPENIELISKIFRILHTIKGTCGFLGLPRLEKVAHKGEDVLGLFRAKKLSVTPFYISLIFECFDCIKLIVQGLEVTGQEPSGDDSELITRLEAVLNDGEKEKSAAEEVSHTSANSPEFLVPADKGMIDSLKSLTLQIADSYNQLRQAVQQRDQEELIGDLKQLNEVVSALQVENQLSILSKLLKNLMAISLQEGLGRLEKLSYSMEKKVTFFCKTKIPFTKVSLTQFSPCFDTVNIIVSEIESTGFETFGDDSEIIAGIESLPNEADSVIQIEAAVTEALIVPQMTTETTDRTAVKNDGASPQTLRVNMDVLENLMTMVSELVLTRNQLLQIARQQEKGELLAPLQHLNHVVSDLQEEIMKTRMQPIGNAWAKLPRIIRDLGKELGKNIDLEMYGNETELDRQILDMIKDPLTHMVRNSADHGIEKPEERIVKGKPATGKIILKAYHQGGHIHIVISDDGKGLAVDKISKKILQNGLATEEQLAAMTHQQIQQYIFHAGFSTAEKVTSVSGRGVGMDVVRSNIEKIGGFIEMQSEEGKGTVFTIKIPLTLAIVSALIVGIGEQRFAIPQLAVSELVLTGAENGHQIETIDNTCVLRLRGSLLPLVSLAETLGVKPSEQKTSQYIVVTKVGASSYGLIVDYVYDLEEIVIKPLSSTLKNIPIFAGNTILGDGCVIMILDPAGILKTVGMQENSESRNGPEEIIGELQNEHLLLLFEAGNQTLKAAPVDMISRLEEIEMTDIEYSDGSPVIQYMGQFIPIHNLDETPKSVVHRPLIILHHQGYSAGLLADRILDITKYRGEFLGNDHNPIFGSVIINDTVTDIVNARLFASRGTLISEGASSHA